MKLRNILAGVASMAIASALPAVADCGNCGPEGHKTGQSTAMSSDQKDHKHHSTAMSSSSQSELSSDKKSVRLSKLMEANATTKNGNRLGEVKDFLIDPETGKIQFAVLGSADSSGVSSDRLPVPWDAVNLESEQQFTINVDPEKFRSAPRTDSEYSNLNDQNYSITIYRFYAIPDSAMGGSDNLEGESMEEQESSGSGSDETDLQESSTSDGAERSSTY
jgi:sporulation protein YlmC with PRC-barrel domain